MNINEASKKSGLNPKMIRYYEKRGIMPKAKRSTNGYRVYFTEDIQTLRFIKRARSLDFSLSEIKKLVYLLHNKVRSSRDVKSLVLKHITEINFKIKAYKSLKKDLSQLAESCLGNDNSQCAILDKLSSS